MQGGGAGGGASAASVDASTLAWAEVHSGDRQSTQYAPASDCCKLGSGCALSCGLPSKPGSVPLAAGPEQWQQGGEGLRPELQKREPVLVFVDSTPRLGV